MKKFEELQIGDYFIFENQTFIKIIAFTSVALQKLNSIRTSDWRLGTFDNNDIVIPVKGN